MKYRSTFNGRLGMNQRAFTLVEVVMAMGIFAFAIVIILSLLSSLVVSSRDSWMQTRSAHLARQIQDDLQANPEVADGTSAQATSDKGLVLQSTNNVVQVSLQAAALTTNTVYYTSDGIATNQTSAVFQVQIVLQPVSIEMAASPIPARTVTQLEIDIRPASQTSAVPFKFFSRLTQQDSD